MRMLVTYATRYGATQQIAERIAERLKEAGLEVDTQPVQQVDDVSRYDAIVLGSAVYYGSWLKEATGFAQRHQQELAARPLWLFSSGPLGDEPTDAQGRDLLEVSVPNQVAELQATLRPREHSVFFGALNRRKLHFADRLVASLPAFPGVEGDFRDWPAVERWADAIAEQLVAAPVGVR